MLTVEDKQWMLEQWESFAGRFATKEQLEQVAGQLEQVAGQVERLAGQVEQVAGQVERVAGQLERVAEQLESFAERFATKEQLERVETRLLTEFHKWASPVEMRQRTHSAALRAIDMEMEALDDRVQKLERSGPHPEQ